MNYSNRVLEYYQNPQHAGSLDIDDPAVGTAVIGDPASGDVVKLQIFVEEGVILKARFKTFGCGSAIAASEWTAHWATLKPFSQAFDIKAEDISQALNLPPNKMHCAVIVRDALKAAILHYKKKHHQLNEVEQRVYEEMITSD